MFDNEYNIVGKHATYMKFLVNDAKVFVRYIDVYMNAAVIGYLKNRTAKRDNESKDIARIPTSAFATERLNCDFIFRLIMLLDESGGLSNTERLDRAFRNDSKKKTEDDKVLHAQNMDLFHSYVYGGIEELYEELTEGSTSRDDYINSVYDITNAFKEEIEGINYEDKLKQLVESN